MDIRNSISLFHTSRAFTLIELLVVITIIGGLAAIVLNQTSTARIKARDAARINQIVEIRKALDFYHSVNGAYITSLESLNPVYATQELHWSEYFNIKKVIAFVIPGKPVCKAYGEESASNNDLENDLSLYLNVSKFAPNGPEVEQRNYSYLVSDNGEEYCLGIELESSDNMPAINNTFCASGPEEISLNLDAESGYAIGTTQSYTGSVSYSVCSPGTV